MFIYQLNILLFVMTFRIIAFIFYPHIRRERIHFKFKLLQDRYSQNAQISCKNKENHSLTSNI